MTMIAKNSIFFIFFFSSIFYSSINAMEFYSLIKAMEDVTQSIKKQLLILDTVIIKSTQELRLAIEQKNKDKIAYENYYKNYQEECKNTFWRPYFDYQAPAIKNYKGDIIWWYNIDNTIRPIPIYYNNGSEGRCEKLKRALEIKKTIYTLFKADLERGERFNNIEYLKYVKETIKDYLDTLEQTQ